MNKKKLLEKIINNPKNINFNDFKIIVESFGFELSRVNGSHHIFKNDTISEIINIQSVKNEAKPYQIKQFLAIVEKYNLRLEE